MQGPILAGFALALWISAICFVRGGRGTTLALGASAVAWVAAVAAMTEAGYAGNPHFSRRRLAAVCTGVGARVAQSHSRLARRAGLPRLEAWAPTVTAVVLLAAGIPLALTQVDEVKEVHEASESQAELYAELSRAVSEAGGPEQVLECGDLYTGRYCVPVLAWELGVHVGEIGIHPQAPGVIFGARGAPPIESARSPFRLFSREGQWRVLAVRREPFGESR